MTQAGATCGCLCMFAGASGACVYGFAVGRNLSVACVRALFRLAAATAVEALGRCPNNPQGRIALDPCWGFVPPCGVYRFAVMRNLRLLFGVRYATALRWALPTPSRAPCSALRKGAPPLTQAGGFPANALSLFYPFSTRKATAIAPFFVISLEIIDFFGVLRLFYSFFRLSQSVKLLYPCEPVGLSMLYPTLTRWSATLSNPAKIEV